jgi:hypothetical protein
MENEKAARVIPLFIKKSQGFILDNCRPISILLVVKKLMGSILFDLINALLNFEKEHQVILGHLILQVLPHY